MRWGALAFVLSMLFASHARAEEIRLVEVPEGQVRVDGSLRDWEGVPFASIGSTGAQLRYAVGYAANGFFFALRVSDQRFVRTERPGMNEDAVIFTLVVPARNGWQATELWLFAGDSGESEASAGASTPGHAPHALTGVDIVEGPMERGGPGYALEAFVPFASIPGGARWREGRAALRLHDVDSESRPLPNDEVATARFDAAHPEALPLLMPGATSNGGDPLAQFLRQSHLESVRRSIDLRADLVGGSEPDRVVLVGNTLVLVPTNGAAGSPSYAFATLPFGADAEVQRPTLVDVNAEPKRELSFVVRTRSALGTRSTMYFAAFAAGTVDIVGIFDIERVVGSCSLTNSVARIRARTPVRWAVTAVPSRCATPSSWSWPSDTVSFLLPWGEITERVYEWRNGQLSVVSETRNPNPYRAPTQATAPSPVPTRSESATPSAAALVTLFRSEQRIAPSVLARFETTANVAENATPERVAVIGRSVLVTGPSFRNGTSYLFFNLAVANDNDVLSMSADDVTGDGVAELLVRVRQSANDAQTRQQFGELVREYLLVYSVESTTARRVGAFEVARAVGGNRMEANVRVVGSGRTRHLELQPGRVTGWTRSNHPFANITDDAFVYPWSAPTRYSLVRGELSVVR